MAGHIGASPFSSLQFATALLFHQVYGASGHSKFITVDYLGVLGRGDHGWWLTFKRINPQCSSAGLQVQSTHGCWVPNAKRGYPIKKLRVYKFFFGSNSIVVTQYDLIL